MIRQPTYQRSALANSAETDSLTGLDVLKNVIAVAVVLGVILYQTWEKWA